MKSIRIYQTGEFEPGQTVELDKAAGNHLLRVLRLKNQQVFTLFNGLGGEYKVQLEIAGKKAIAHIQSFSQPDNESSLNIHLLQGVSKGDRMDIAIQKSVELGVNTITPVICERSVVNLKGERAQKKQSHWQGIAISACEQSGRNYLPEVTQPRQFKDLSLTETDSLNLILNPLSKNTFQSLKPVSNHITIFIGPEGGLSAAEIDLAKSKKFQGVNMGPRILRTETAALAAITSVQLLWGDLG